jgi:uncharacterized protein YndB with AHSA1/START domain
MSGRTTVERTSDREIVVTRTFDGPARIVFDAWTRPELMKRWWVPKSLGMSLLSVETDVRVGGGYRLEFKHPASEAPIAFFGKYTEVTPPSRLVWTNDESEEGAISTLTLEEKGGKTLLTLHEIYPTTAALETPGGGAEAAPEQFEQLDELLVTLTRE